MDYKLTVTIGVKLDRERMKQHRVTEDEVMGALLELSLVPEMYELVANNPDELELASVTLEKVVEEGA
jgi:hypothetical protein